VPALICGSFSDNNLHGRGSFRGWQHISSADRFLYTHRGGKWATFYADGARAAQLRFFDRYLRGHDVPAPPPVRLEVRERRDVISGVRDEDSWPLDRTGWTPLYLTADGLAAAPPTSAGGAGFGRDRITTGWLKASLRALDETASQPYEPVPACTRRQPLDPARWSRWTSRLARRSANRVKSFAPPDQPDRAGQPDQCEGQQPAALDQLERPELPGRIYGWAASHGGPRYTPFPGGQGYCAGLARAGRLRESQPAEGDQR
jgi:hypothetical protein